MCVRVCVRVPLTYAKNTEYAELLSVDLTGPKGPGGTGGVWGPSRPQKHNLQISISKPGNLYTHVFRS